MRPQNFSRETFYRDANREFEDARWEINKQAWDDSEVDAAIGLVGRDLLDFHVRRIKPKKVLEKTCEPTLAGQPASPCEVAMQPAAPCEVAIQPAATCEVAMQPVAP